MNAELENRFLREGASGRWAASNEQWWDWYMSLAVNPSPVTDLVPGPCLPDDTGLPLADAEAELDTEVDVDPEAVTRFRSDGFVRLKDVISSGALMSLRRSFGQLFDHAALPSMGFPSLEMMWTHDPWCRSFVMSRKLAGIAGQLLGVDAIRLYHDNALIKSPGCGRTPWHYDAHHYPIDSTRVVTAWIPLQPTPIEMGPLVFAKGIRAYEHVRGLDFDKVGKAYDSAIIETLRREAVPIEAVVYDLGDVTFHHTHSLHSAGPNTTDGDRMALATTYFEDGARLVEEPTLISGDFEKFMPGVGPGDVIASPCNPVLWRRTLA
jgi:hypothetical protein